MTRGHNRRARSVKVGRCYSANQGLNPQKSGQRTTTRVPLYWLSQSGHLHEVEWTPKSVSNIPPLDRW